MSRSCFLLVFDYKFKHKGLFLFFFISPHCKLILLCDILISVNHRQLLCWKFSKKLNAFSGLNAGSPFKIIPQLQSLNCFLCTLQVG